MIWVSHIIRYLVSIHFFPIVRQCGILTVNIQYRYTHYSYPLVKYLSVPEVEAVDIRQEVRKRVPLGRKLFDLGQRRGAHVPAACDAAEQPVGYVKGPVLRFATRPKPRCNGEWNGIGGTVQNVRPSQVKAKVKRPKLKQETSAKAMYTGKRSMRLTNHDDKELGWLKQKRRGK